MANVAILFFLDFQCNIFNFVLSTVRNFGELSSAKLLKKPRSTKLWNKYWGSGVIYDPRGGKFVIKCDVFLPFFFFFGQISLMICFFVPISSVNISSTFNNFYEDSAPLNGVIFVVMWPKLDVN